MSGQPMIGDCLSIDPRAITILNVDDSEALRYHRARLLRSAGYRVLEAGSGKEALHLVAEAKPQLMLLDVRLPDRGGLEICRTLKTVPATAPTMVLLISAEATRGQDRISGLEHGADGYLVEPVNPEELLATVKALLRLYRSEEQLRLFAAELEQRVQDRTFELGCSQERLRALATELNLAEQRERKRLATELHDHLQQMLVFGRLTIGQSKRYVADVPAAAEAMNKVDAMLSDALAYTRTLVADLSPTVLRDHGLASALKWLAQYMAQKHEQTVTVIVPEDDGLRLSEDQRVLLFQSVRELLINASKHAGTGAATVRMTQHDQRVQIEVYDEGKGFDLAAAAAAAAAAGTPNGGISSKFGLYSIQERMRALGGSYDIQSAPGQGTRATLTLPLG